jgi:hypothetical protein
MSEEPQSGKEPATEDLNLSGTTGEDPDDQPSAQPGPVGLQHSGNLKGPDGWKPGIGAGTLGERAAAMGMPSPDSPRDDAEDSNS